MCMQCVNRVRGCGASLPTGRVELEVDSKRRGASGEGNTVHAVPFLARPPLSRRIKTQTAQLLHAFSERGESCIVAIMGLLI